MILGLWHLLAATLASRLYGVVEPLSGWHWSQSYPQLNREYFQQCLDELSQPLGDTVAVMQLDRAQPIEPRH